MKKNLTAIVAALAMLIAMMPGMAFADAAECAGGEECTHEAAIGTTHYDKLQEAVSAADSGDVVTILKNITLPDQAFVTVGAEADITLDLNGYELFGNNKDRTVLINGKLTIRDNSANQTGKITGVTGQQTTVFASGASAQLTVERGTITSPNRAILLADGAKLSMTGGKVTGNYGVRVNNAKTDVTTSAYISGGDIYGTACGVYVNANIDPNDRETLKPAEVTISETAKISGGTGIIVYGKGGKVIVNGGTITGGDSKSSYAIGGNGTVSSTMNLGGTVIEINGGTIIGSSIHNCAVYHPQVGALKITGGTISGYGGVQICAGTLEISGTPTITATGANNFASSDSDGYLYDGAAISVVDRNYPGGTPTVTIKGNPTVIAEQAESPVAAYTWSDKTQSEWSEAGDNVNISGGHYSARFDEELLSEEVKNNYKDFDEDAPYTIGETAENIIKNAEKGDTITLIKSETSITVPEGVVIENQTDSDITVNGNTINSGEQEPAAHIHNAVKTEAKAATCTENGNIAYWYCEGCDKYFSDEALLDEITLEATVIQATGKHTYENGVCTVCGEKDPNAAAGGTTDPADKPDNQDKSDNGQDKPDNDESSKTGDDSNMAIWFALMLASAIAAGGTVIYRRKRNNN